MRRDKTTPQTPDVEASRAELDALAGSKDTVQAEFLVVAEDKKRLESEYETRKREISDDLAIVRRETDIEKGKLLTDNASLKKENEQLGHDNRSLRSDSAVLGETYAKIQSDIRDAETKLGTLRADVKKLSDERIQLSQNIELLSPELQTLTSALTNGRAELRGIELAKLQTTEKLGALAADHASKGAEHTDFVAKNKAEREEADRTLTDVKNQIVIKRDELKDVTDKVAELEATITAYREEFTKKDLEITKRMGDASRLETHVDEKLQSLKTLESAFTTEHLARFGYTKTG